MNTKFRLIALMILSSIIMNCTATWGQNISFYSLTTQDGLSHIKVNDIYNDEYGMVWIATDYGLNRYDGHSVEVFINDKDDQTTIPHDKITRITGDGNGHLWIVCNTGLVEFNLNTMKFKTINKGTVNAVYFDKNANSLYIAKGRKVLKCNREKKFLEVVALEVVSHISDIIVDGQTIFAGTSGQGIWKIDQSNGSQECIVNSTKVTRLYMDSRSDLWAGSWEDGLCRISADGQITMFRHDRRNPESIMSDFVRSCCEDEAGRLWIGTDIGLDCHDPQTGRFIHHYRQNDSFSRINYPSIWCMTRDIQGNIWLGSYFGGVNWFNPEYEVYTWYKPSPIEGEGLSFPVVGCIQEDNRGNLWIATEGGGVNYLDRKSGRIKWYTKKKHGLASDNIQTLYYDQEDEILWIGTHLGGMDRLDIKKGTIRHCFPGPKGSYPVYQSIIKDIVPYRDSLVIGTLHGVYMYDINTGNYRRMFKRNDIRKAAVGISDLHIDNDENLWVSIVNKGVLCHHLPSEKTVWFQQPGEDSISDTNIGSIINDDEGNIWFSTSYSGVDRYDRASKEFSNYSLRNNTFAPNHTYTITKSVASDKLLISTPGGFCTFDPATRRSVSYNKSNGFPLTDINDNSIHVTRDSTVFIGSIHGLVSFKEGAQYLNKKPYRITMSRLNVNGKEIKPGDKTDILTKALPSTKSLKLRSDAALFSIDVSTSDYLSADRCDLEYCLYGFSDEWNPLRQNTITYSNLTPGKYTLYIRPAHDNREICSETSLDIVVSPPWYSSWWALTIWILLGLTLIVLAIRFYNRSIQMRDAEELNQSKLNFFTNISHEIRTPLTVIVAQVESLIYSKEFTPVIYNKILSIYKNSVHLKGLISELLEFRKQEKGELKIKATPNDIVKLVSEFYLVFEEYANTRKITLKMEKEINHLEVWYDRTQLQKVFRNLLSNALKYTEPGGEVNMFLGMEGNRMLFKISDTGCGMSESEKVNIFDNFYRIEKDEKYSEGTGIGLALAKGIIEQHHGTINVESTVGKGTTFTITLPLGYSHFSPEQIEDEMPEEHEMVADQVTIDGQSRKKDKTMLIVDDNESIRTLLIDIFTPFYSILTAADGEKGWEIVQSELPDIVVSDVLMPKMPGTDLCRKIKSETTTCHIPVVLLTARVDIEHNIEGILTGADDYIAKPFNTKLLISRCNNLVNSRIILQEKFSQNPDMSSKMLATNVIDQDIIDKATAIIEQNMENSEFNINVFAHEMAMSRTSLFTKMKAITGQTPNDFVMTLRLKRAAFLLKNNPELSILEIADRTGFNSVKYFSKCFNDVYHIRPANYRNSSES